MRWESLFADLEAQWAARESEDLDQQIAEALELERSRMLMADRLRAAVGGDHPVRLRGGLGLQLRISEVGADWLWGHVAGQAVLVPLQALESVGGLALRAAAEPSRTRQRLGITAPLRALARDGQHVVVHGAQGPLGEGLLTHVGRDHIDVRTGSPPEAGDGASGGEQASGSGDRNPGAPTLTIPLNAVVMLRSR